jgi:hypothetical protein
VGQSGTIIKLAGRAWASLGARGPARHGPLANPGRADTVLIRAGPSRARAGTARPAHLDIYSWPHTAPTPHSTHDYVAPLVP